MYWINNLVGGLDKLELFEVEIFVCFNFFLKYDLGLLRYCNKFSFFIWFFILLFIFFFCESNKLRKFYVVEMILL